MILFDSQILPHIVEAFRFDSRRLPASFWQYAGYQVILDEGLFEEFEGQLSEMWSDEEDFYGSAVMINGVAVSVGVYKGKSEGIWLNLGVDYETMQEDEFLFDIYQSIYN